MKKLVLLSMMLAFIAACTDNTPALVPTTTLKTENTSTPEPTFTPKQPTATLPPTASSTPSPMPSPTPSPSPSPIGEMCDSLDLSDDLVAGFSVETTHPINQKEYGCLVVSGGNGFPVLAGKQSFRFEVRPGDCSGNEGWDDCPNDRSRHEIQEKGGTFNGEMAIYETNLYVPIQPKFKPRGGNIMFLNQLNTMDMSQNHFGTLVYLEVDNDHNLLLRTHKGFSWDIERQVVVANNIFERWINIRYEVFASPDSTGYIRVYVDDQLALSESRPTIPSENGHLAFRVGIYNAFISEAEEAFENQVIFVDQTRKYFD